MIIQRTATSQLLFTQPDHAALAGQVMRPWRDHGLQESPRRASILLAVDEHDNGWKEVDVAPLIDPTTGGVLDFIHAPEDVRRGIWPRGIERLAATPYAAALVAQHALHVYRRWRGDAGWAPFFDRIERERDYHLQLSAQGTLEDLLDDYLFVRIGDLASLTFCNGWTDVQTDDSGHTVRLDGTHVIVTPDPYAGARVPLSIIARELPDRPFASEDEAYAAFAAAPVIRITGVASGE
jgi:hypothetical protein